jgi:hypothetical protein
MAKTTKIDEVAFAGRSGTRYDFRIYVWETKFKAVPGVYVSVANHRAGPTCAVHAPLQPARRPDLAALKRHPRDECFQMYYGNVVGVLKEDDDARRTSILTDLLGGLVRCATSPRPSDRSNASRHSSVFDERRFVAPSTAQRVPRIAKSTAVCSRPRPYVRAQGAPRGRNCVTVDGTRARIRHRERGFIV